MLRRKSTCSGASMPSATVSMPSLRASSTMDSTTSWARWESSRKKLRSNFTESTMKDLSSPSDENPAPKSSSEQRKPSSCMRRMASFTFRISPTVKKIDSVSSSSIRPPGIWYWSRISANRCRKSVVWKCRRERFTATGNTGAPCARRPASMAQTSSNTYKSSRQMSPLRSNTGIKSEG